MLLLLVFSLLLLLLLLMLLVVVLLLCLLMLVLVFLSVAVEDVSLLEKPLNIIVSFFFCLPQHTSFLVFVTVKQVVDEGVINYEAITSLLEYITMNFEEGPPNFPRFFLDVELIFSRGRGRPFCASLCSPSVSE